MQRSILFIADSESQLRPAYVVASHLARHLNASLVGNVVPQKSGISGRQVASAGIECPLVSRTMRRLMEEETPLNFDVVVAFLTGTSLLHLLTRMQAMVGLSNQQRRPILITGYNGVVYERHLEGLLWRVGYDLICVNSKHDEKQMSAWLKTLGASSSSLVRTGLVLAQSPASPAVPADATQSEADPKASNGRVMDSLDDQDEPEEERRKTLLFATQAIVPKLKKERLYILGKLVQYAEQFPDRLVYIKPRTLPGERTFHQEDYHYEALYREIYGTWQPPNLHFAYGALSSYLDKTDLLVTVSSTAVFEALSRGVRGAILTDVGIKESLGNHFYLGSNLYATMDDLIADRVPRVDQQWLNEQGLASEDNLDNLSRRVDALLKKQAKDGKLLEWPPIFYTAQYAPHLHEATTPFNSMPAQRIFEAPRTFVDNTTRKLNKLRRNPTLFLKDAVRKRTTSE